MAGEIAFQRYAAGLTSWNAGPRFCRPNQHLLRRLDRLRIGHVRGWQFPSRPFNSVLVSAMYQPSHFRVDDVPQMHALMRDRPFALLVSTGSEGLCATHLPTVLKGDGPNGVVECHLARANPHWKDLAEGNEALMIFQGPEGYITPNWYPSKADHQKVVPTWNYALVHAYGRPEIMNDNDWLRRHVTELTRQQEAHQAKPWAVTDAPETYIEVMLRGIVGFRFAIARLEGKWKMSQNRETRDRDGVVKGLDTRGAADDIEMAQIMSRS
jgi:transcriptional regulator